jgi:hypothetical protein
VKKKSVAILIALTLSALVGQGCSSARMGTEPWERDLLAKRSMQLDGNPARNGNDAHIYFSKEATSGGSGFGGGGCGCN